jgi:DNA repair protein RecO (recombination protein O)
VLIFHEEVAQKACKGFFESSERPCGAPAVSWNTRVLMKRIQHEPAYVLHAYDFSESSLVLEVFTRHHGRVALIAKGVKKPSSNFRAVLLPLQALSVSYSGDAEVRTLKGAEWMGGRVMPSGDALLSGFYANELVLRTLARDDAHPALFDAYNACVGDLSAGSAASGLRAFELVLLRETGVLPSLGLESSSLAPVAPQADYCLHPQWGLVPADTESSTELSPIAGAHWLQLQSALDSRDWRTLTQACAPCAAALRPQLRAALSQHSGVQLWRTRQVLMEAKAL